MKVYYFTTKERKFQYNSIIIDKAYSLSLYATLLDAVEYANGPILYLVECSDEINITIDSITAQHIEHLQEFDTTEALNKFARMQALKNIEKIKPYCSIEDYELISKWLVSGNKLLMSAVWSAICSTKAKILSADCTTTWTAAWSAIDSIIESLKYADSLTQSSVWSAVWHAIESSTDSIIASLKYKVRCEEWHVANEMLLNLLESETRLSWRIY